MAPAAVVSPRAGAAWVVLGMVLLAVPDISICALGTEPRYAWHPTPSHPTPSLPANARVQLRAQSLRKSALVALRGGGDHDTSDSEDMRSSVDWVYDRSGERVVKINPLGFDPDERRAEFRNRTLRQLEADLQASLAELREKSWTDATEEEDAMTDHMTDHVTEAHAPQEVDSVDFSSLPEWLREALEKQTLPVEQAGMTSFLEKYQEFASGQINTSNVEQGLAYMEAKLGDDDEFVQSKKLLGELKTSSDTEDYRKPQGVGLSVSCTAPLHICVVTQVVPVLSAWDEGVEGGDVILAINGRAIKDIVNASVTRYQALLRQGGYHGDVQIKLDAARRHTTDWKTSNETDGLIHETLKHLLSGPPGSTVNVTIQRTFRYIQRTMKGEIWRHELYDGRPVLKNLVLTCRNKEDIPPNWVVGMRPKMEHLKVHRRERLLAELREANAISEERYAFEMAKIPEKIIVGSASDENLFEQVYPCYYNTVSKVLALKRPLYDQPPPAFTDRLRFLTSQMWDAATAGNVSEVRNMIVEGANVSWRNPDWRLATALHKAAEHGHLEVAQELVRAGAHVTQTNQLGWTALHYACFANSNIHLVRYLLERGADANAATESGYTPLHMCAFKGNYHGMQALLKEGADKSAKEKYMRVNAAELVMMYPKP
jgi:hypothetical protein